MKKLFPAFMMLIIMLVSCTNEKPYTISGSIELPDSLLVGDSLIATPSMEGWQVYMLDLDGQTVDSVEISDNKFIFSGNVDKENPFFVYLASDLCVGLIAVEPGNISVVIDSESLSASGTPVNDFMMDLDASLVNLQQDTYTYMAELTEQYGEMMNDSLLMPLYQDFMSQYTLLVDSFYQVAPDNLSSVYCVNVLTSNAQSSEDLLEAVSEYPEYIQDSPLIQARVKYLRSIESYYQMLNGETNDTTTFNLDELMRDAQISSTSEN